MGSFSCIIWLRLLQGTSPVSPAALQLKRGQPQMTRTAHRKAIVTAARKTVLAPPSQNIGSLHRRQRRARDQTGDLFAPLNYRYAFCSGVRVYRGIMSLSLSISLIWLPPPTISPVIYFSSVLIPSILNSCTAIRRILNRRLQSLPSGGRPPPSKGALTHQFRKGGSHWEPARSRLMWKPSLVRKKPIRYVLDVYFPLCLGALKFAFAPGYRGGAGPGEREALEGRAGRHQVNGWIEVPEDQSQRGERPAEYGHAHHRQVRDATLVTLPQFNSWVNLIAVLKVLTV